MLYRMLHDQYTRRRTADSFHEEYEHSKEVKKQNWSWNLFLGILIVQFFSRSAWVSFGVISSFILDDIHHSGKLLWTPVTFSIFWNLSEPWVKKLCDKIENSVELMYVVLVGLSASWCGLIIAVKCPLTLLHLVPLIGVLGGLGTSFSITACQVLTEKHFPNRSGALRSFNQSAAALSLFITPVLSFFIMSNFGDHGGLLIHAGLLMQGMVGGVLLKNAVWVKDEMTSNQPVSPYSFQEDGWVESPEIIEHEDEGLNDREKEQMWFWKKVTTELSAQENNLLPRDKLPRSRSFPTKARRCNPFGVEILPSISEVNESVGSSGEVEHISDLRKSIEELHRLSCTIAEVRQTVNFLQKPPRTFQYKPRTLKSDEEPEPVHSKHLSLNIPERVSLDSDSSLSENNNEYSEKSSDKVFDGEPQRNEKTDSETGERNPTGKLLEKEILQEGAETRDVNDEQKGNANSSKKEREFFTKMISERMEGRERMPRLRRLAGCVMFYVRHVILNKINLHLPHSTLVHPLLLPSAFLLFSIQFSYLGLISLTPTLVIRYVEDSTKEESAFTVCLMGFTWLCFVIASPCFSTIDFTNHQIICIMALGPSAFSCYMLSESVTQDEVALYASMYGVCHGVTLMTSHSILKLSFGGSAQLQRMRPCFNTSVALFMVFTVLLMGLFQWTNDLRNCYKLFATLLTLSMIIWAVQGCIASVRARRGRHSITWARRRRVS